VRNGDSAAVEILFPPTFVQSRLFLVLCVAVTILVAALLLRWRHLQVT